MGKTQEEIADEVGVEQKTISIKLKEIEEKTTELYQNPTSELGIKYEFLKDKMASLYPLR
jgi:DNA-binding XRE family transcriptional regulator